MRFRPAPQCVIATKRNAVVQNLANSEHGHLAALALRATARDNVHSIVSVLAEIISDDDQRAVPPSLREGEQE